MKIAIVETSNPTNGSLDDRLPGLESQIAEAGFEAVYAYRNLNPEKRWRVDPQVRADILNAQFTDDDVAAIFDTSGGDLANEVLDLLDFDAIRANPKPFVGYSDLTVVHTAIAAGASIPTVLWNPVTAERRAAGDVGKILAGERLLPTATPVGEAGELPDLPIVGGNIRCFVKTAGTRHFPADLRGRLLLLEAYSPRLEMVATYLAQLSQMGVFAQVEGLILGEFTAIADRRPELIELAAEYGIPMWDAPKVGHNFECEPVTLG